MNYSVPHIYYQNSLSEPGWVAQLWWLHAIAKSGASLDFTRSRRSPLVYEKLLRQEPNHDWPKQMTKVEMLAYL